MQPTSWTASLVAAERAPRTAAVVHTNVACAHCTPDSLGESLPASTSLASPAGPRFSAGAPTTSAWTRSRRCRKCQPGCTAQRARSSAAAHSACAPERTGLRGSSPFRGMVWGKVPRQSAAGWTSCPWHGSDRQHLPPTNTRCFNRRCKQHSVWFARQPTHLVPRVRLQQWLVPGWHIHAECDRCQRDVPAHGM